MMKDEFFVLSLAVVLTLIFRWAFKALPRENWQIIAAMPKEKLGSGEWKGENLTFYGFFTASAYIFAVVMIFILLGSLSVPMPAVAGMIIFVLIVCIPSSVIIARIVEKKAYTFTTGGASFVGILIVPWIAAFADFMLKQMIQQEMNIPIMPVMAAFSIGYTFGEGLGRLACISFGCCYGKALSDCPVFVQKLFGKRHFVFFGKTKKIAYAHALDGQKVIPIQAITIILYSISGLSGIYLFLQGFYHTAYIETLAITQLWRFFSEFLRADYRGAGKISAYQIMSLLAVIYACGMMGVFQKISVYQTDILAGIAYLWNPLMILLLQGLWTIVFLHTGRSKVTGASMNFYTIRERI